MADTVAIRNIGTLISGDVHAPIHPATSLYIEGGVIREIGTARPGSTDIDLHGATLAPGLWDSHNHPYFGDYSPRQEAAGTITRTVRAGVTTLVSAGPGHQPGMYLPSPNLPNVQAVTVAGSRDPRRARDARGAKALAIVMTESWRGHRPLGVKVHAGTVFAEDGFVRDDFVDLASAGVRVLKFQRPISRSADAIAYRRWAGEAGLLVMTHTGNRALTRDSTSIAQSLKDVDPDIAGHINGGPTPAPPEAVDWLIDRGKAALDIVFIGNMRVAAHALRRALDRGEPERPIIGTDLPGGTGIVPTGVLRTIQLLNQVTDVPVADLYCMATGNTAAAFGLPGGRVAVGEPADLVAWDPADGSDTDEFLDCVTAGDRPYPGLVMIDGVVAEHGNPLLLEPKRMPTIRTSGPDGEGG